MKPGSLVLTVYNFDEERKVWGYNYPYKNDILTVKAITPNTSKDFALFNGEVIPYPRKQPIVNLWFEELNLPTGLADKKVDGSPNFIEIQSPEEGMEIIKEANKKETVFYDIPGLGCIISEGCLFPDKKYKETYEKSRG